jgi:hypothetical protein
LDRASDLVDSDRVTVHRLNVNSVPVDGFWSISVYNAEGFFSRIPSTCSLNNVTAQKHADGPLFSSAAAMARFHTACQSCRAGIIWFACTVRVLKS